MGLKRRREHTARTFNRVAHVQKRQFLKIELCQKLRTELDVSCRYAGCLDGYVPKDKTRQPEAKLKSRYKRYDFDNKAYI